MLSWLGKRLIAHNMSKTSDNLGVAELSGRLRALDEYLASAGDPLSRRFPGSGS